MGKGSRLRDERAAAREAAAAPPTVEMLGVALRAVGDLYGTTADCAAAAALLKLTAGHLGFELTPRPVSLYARQPSTGTEALMGPKATALIPPSKLHRVEDYTPNGANTGHMILTSEEPPMLFDPNLRQLGGYGVPAPSIGLRIKSTTPVDGRWAADLPDLKVVYMLDDNAALWERYEDALIGHANNAAELARMIRSGTSSDQIRGRMKRPAP